MNADAVQIRVEHTKRDLDRLRRRALMRHHDIGKDEPRKFGAGAPELVATAQIAFAVSTPASARKSICAAARVDRTRLESTAIDRLHVGQQKRLGKPPAKRGHDVRDAFVLEQRRPHFDDGDPASQRRTGNRETLLDGGDIDRNLEREAGPETIEDTGGRRTGSPRRLQRPGISRVAPPRRSRQPSSRARRSLPAPSRNDRR